MKFELFLIGKGLSNNYTHQSMKTIKVFLNWAFKKGYNRNMAYKSYSQRFHDETKSDSTMNHFALTDEELEAVMSFPTNRAAIDRVRDMFVFSCYTGRVFRRCRRCDGRISTAICSISLHQRPTSASDSPCRWRRREYLPNIPNGPMKMTHMYSLDCRIRSSTNI